MSYCPEIGLDFISALSIYTVYHFVVLLIDVNDNVGACICDGFSIGRFVVVFLLLDVNGDVGACVCDGPSLEGTVG